MYSKLRTLLLPFFVLVFSVFTTVVQAQTATVTTDKPDYAPRSNAVFTGSGFQPGETVALRVKNLFRACNTVTADSSYLPWTVVADAGGNFVTNWTVCDCDGDSLRLRAVGQISHDTAFAFFSDASNQITKIAFLNQPGSFTYGVANTTGLVVQTQNSNSAAETVNGNASQSVTIEVTSNSSTGRFSSSSGGSFNLTTIMLNVGTGQSQTPDFFYRDNFVGNVTFTAKVTARTNATSLPIGSQATLTKAINKANSNTSIISDVNPVSAGANVRFTATVTHGTSGGAGTPTGTVDFKDGTTLLDNVALNSSGIASFSTSTLSSGTHSITATYKGDDNFNTSTSSLSQKINDKQNQTITFNTLGNRTYGDADFTLNATTSSGLVVTYTVTGDATISGNTVHITGAGSATITAKQSGDAAYNAAPDVSRKFTIIKADQTINWSDPEDINYNAPLTSTQLNAVVSGVTGGTAVGAITYTPVSGTVLDAGDAQALRVDVAQTANYNSATKTVHINVKKAASNTTVTVSNASYDGNAHGGNASVSGVGGLSQSLTVTYSGSGTTTYGPSTTAPTNAGTYSASATFTGDANHNTSSDSKTFTIAKANAVSFNVDGYTGIYDGNSHGATGTTKGVESTPADLSNLFDLGSSFTDAGEYMVDWTFNKIGISNYNSNYNSAGGKVLIEISQAPSVTTITITGTPFTYTGSAITPATVSITGAGGLNLTPSATYSNNTNAGTATVSYSFAGDANHKPSSASKTFTISKADATVDVNGYTGSYDGDAHGATGTAKGVKGESLTGLDLGDKFTNVPGGTATWTFTDATGNYKDATGSAKIEISKANAIIKVTPYSVTYDGKAHTANGTATGVESTPDNLSNLLTLSTTTHTKAGDYTGDAWSFAGNNNYHADNGTVDDAIAKANATIDVKGYTGTYNGAAHGATGTATGVGDEDLSSMLHLGSSYTNVPGGTANWTFDGDDDYNSDAGKANIVIGKAQSVTTITITGAPFTYTGDPITPASVSVTGAGGLDVTPDAAYTDNTNAGTATASYTFTGDNNHEGSEDSKNFTIGKANATIAVNGYTGTYDGDAHGATGTAKGVKGESLTGLDLGDKFTDVPGGTANWTFTDAAGNYKDATGTAAIEIGKAISTTVVTINGGPFTYTGSAIKPATVKVTGAGGLSLTPKPSYTNNVNAGTATASYNYEGDNNHEESHDSKDFTIGKANAVITVTPYSVTYDGDAHTSAFTALGVEATPADLSALITVSGTTHTKAGDYKNDQWSFAGNDNYKATGGTVDNAIGKAPSVTTIAITGDPFTYTGAAQKPASVSVKGAGGLNLTPDADYADNTNAGTATASYSFAGDENHNPSNDSRNFTIGKANATIHVNGYTGTYDGNAHGATGTATGVKSEALAGLVLGEKFTDAPGGTATWTFTDVTGNYKNATGTASFVISKATSTTVVTIAGGPFTYSGNPITPATVKVSGAGGLSLMPTATYANNTNAGTATASYTFAGDGNHEGSEDSKTFAIDKANATIIVNSYTGVYDAAAHGATGTAKGVKTEDLSSLLHLGNSFTNVPGGTANWTFDGNSNYNSDAGTASIAISKVNATITVNGYSGTYDGNAHGATGAAKGVKSESLTGLDLGDKFTNAPGGAANWTFTDATGNYKNATGTTAIVIGKASTTTTVTVSNATYDGNTHGGSAKVSGAAGLDQSVTVYYAGVSPTVYASSTTAPTNAGTYKASAKYAESANYFSSTDSKEFTIAKTNATVTVTPYSVTYDGFSHTATGSAIGAKGETLSGLNLTGTTHTDKGTYTDSWTFTDVTGNYNNTSGSVNDAIGQASACVTYNGDLFKNTTSTTGGSATVNISVVISKNPSDAPGDISTAVISKFYVAYNGTTTTISSGITKTVSGSQVTYSAPYLVSLSSTELSKTLDVTWDLTGNYAATNSCSDNASEVTVSAPSSDFITGGGYAKQTVNSNLKYAGDVGSKSNFGFSVKWNKSYTTLQGGGVNAIFRTGTTLYQLKSTKVLSLTVVPKTATTPASATITSNAVINKIIGGVIVSSEGNLTSVLEITDICEPGAGMKASTDQIAITVKDKNGVTLYSSQWDATTKKTLKQTLDGGNIQIHNGNTTEAPTCTSSQVVNSQQAVTMNTVVPEVTDAKFGLTAFPNPTQDQFKVHVESSNTRDKIMLRVFDLNGRTVRLIRDVTAGQTITLGNEYRPGIYFVEILQGKNRKQIKLLKVVY